MAEIIFEPRGFKEAAERLQESRQKILSRMDRLLRKVGHILIGGGKGSGPLGRATPVRTGKLRNSTVGEILGGPKNMRLEIRQGARTPEGFAYGQAVIGGARPHEIRPRRAKVLRFLMGDRIVFATLVHHPGNKPNPYHERLLAANMGKIQEVVTAEGMALAADLWKPKITS